MEFYDATELKPWNATMCVSGRPNESLRDDTPTSVIVAGSYFPRITEKKADQAGQV